MYIVILGAKVKGQGQISKLKVKYQELNVKY